MTAGTLLILGALVVVAALAGATIAVSAYTAPDARPSLWRRPIRRTVLVVLDDADGTTLRGVLLSHRPHLVTLGGAARLNGPDAPPTTIDGTVYLDTRRIRWIQSPEE